MSEPIRAAHAREAWLAIYLKALEITENAHAASHTADIGLRDYVARFGDADLRKDLDECTAVGGAG